ncbi:AraC family transcriptional regulator [Chitinophaga lutea]
MQLPDFRSRYQPVQPAVSLGGDAVRYTERLPDPRLCAYVYCYWELQTNAPLQEPFYYRVVADGCIDIFADLLQPQAPYVMGFSTAYTEFPLPPSFHYIGIRFLPAAFPLLFHTDAGTLTNRFEPLDAVTPRFARALSALIARPGIADMPAMLDETLLRQLRDPAPADPRLFEAIGLILDAKGVLPVEKELDTGVSPRQLRRLFDRYIGGSPKTFSKVVRFQHILQAKPSAESLKKNKLFYDSYYDQAHFIKEFKTLSGQTPGAAFR